MVVGCWLLVGVVVVAVGVVVVVVVGVVVGSVGMIIECVWLCIYIAICCCNCLGPSQRCRGAQCASARCGVM